MIKKSKSFFLSLLFIVSSLANALWAEDAVFNFPLTQANMNVFNSACAKVAEKPIVKGTFSQEKLLSRFGRSLVSSGNFIIAAELGMVWDTLQPFPSTMVMANEFILQSRPDGQMSVISAQGNDTFVQMASVISSVFSGNSRGLLENFNVYFTGSVSDWNIGLLPKDKMIASFAEKITMNGGVEIRSIRIYEKSGDVITYTLSNHIYPAELSNNEKAFFKIP